jgi:hypothetical protein
MQINRENTGMDIRTILFLVLFFILVLSSSTIQGNHYKSSLSYSAETELLSGAFSQNHSTVLSRNISMPDLYKFYDCAPNNTRLVSFSISNKTSDCNRRIAQNFILNQKTMLSMDRVQYRRLYSHHFSDDDDIPPALS